MLFFNHVQMLHNICTCKLFKNLSFEEFANSEQSFETGEDRMFKNDEVIRNTEISGAYGVSGERESAIQLSK